MSLGSGWSHNVRFCYLRFAAAVRRPSRRTAQRPGAYCMSEISGERF
jgi:hypothetical protein